MDKEKRMETEVDVTRFADGLCLVCWEPMPDKSEYIDVCDGCVPLCR